MVPCRAEAHAILRIRPGPYLEPHLNLLHQGLQRAWGQPQGTLIYETKGMAKAKPWGRQSRPLTY